MGDELRVCPKNWSQWRDWVAAQQRIFEQCKTYEMLSAHMDAAARQLDDWNRRAPAKEGM